MVERFSMNPVSCKLLNEAWEKEFPDEVAIAERMLALLDELEHYKSREERVTKLVMDNSTSWDALYKKLEAAERRIAEQSAIVAAAEKLVRCKGRYHSELNYRALAKLFGVITPDLPPLEHENVHYADAAEVEITALRQRIAELEAREVTLPPTFWYEHDDLSRDIPVLDKRLVKKAILAAGIKVKGG
ncbi:ead/Ea22-like family protein [Salmonella enterica subsp. enterica]|nr:ead/Ea22-like family protein [Salmonella enterica subsp. enterica]EAW1696682.1 ead/Ea22-like family protein [Salmonella enterica subsp. enterica]EAW1809472.1 ead/Ea22-like family protein [Salmonella enterica subsp. enterica]EBE4792174.1 ead/Ea22-like family protein [Salmonella enterica]